MCLFLREMGLYYTYCSATCFYSPQNILKVFPYRYIKKYKPKLILTGYVMTHFMDVA